ncbi:hypothetical protein MDAP_000059 [Mitosporidium daphniae]
MVAQPSQPQKSSPPLPPSASQISPAPSTLMSQPQVAGGIPKGGDPYGLPGLLSLIRMTDPLASALDLGIDLSSLGLDLASTEPLYLNFVSPWGNPSARLHQLLPPCYNIHSPGTQNSLTAKLSTLSEEALFFLFYHNCAVGGNESSSAVSFLPICADLCRRGWRWHRDAAIWVQPPSAASVAAAAASRESPQASSKSTVYLMTILALFIAFDPARWGKRPFDNSSGESIQSSSSLIDFSVIKSL